MYKVGVIGDKNSVMGFLSLGLTVEYAYDPEEALKKLKALIEKECAVVYVTEELYGQLDLTPYREAVIPAVIPIPGNKGGQGVGAARLKRAVEKAVGADILFND